MAGLVEPGLIQHLEQRAVGGGEAHVAAGHRGEAVGGRLGLAHVRPEFGIEKLVGAHRHGRQQLVAVGEMGVGGADGHAQAPARLGQGEVPDAPLGDELDGGIDQGRPEVAVVVAVTLAWPWHGAPG
jgi:hypothetical protein